MFYSLPNEWKKEREDRKKLFLMFSHTLLVLISHLRLPNCPQTCPNLGEVQSTLLREKEKSPFKIHDQCARWLSWLASSFLFPVHSAKIWQIFAVLKISCIFEAFESELSLHSTVYKCAGRFDNVDNVSCIIMCLHHELTRRCSRSALSLSLYLSFSLALTLTSFRKISCPTAA